MDFDEEELAAACRAGDVAVVQEIIGRYPDAIEQRLGKYGWTPLMLAVDSRQTSLAKWLLEAGAKPGAANYPDQTRLTLMEMRDGIAIEDSLARAVERDSAAMVKLLLDHGASLTAYCSSDWTPLVLAAANNREQALLALIEAGADLDAPASRRFWGGPTALMMAAYENHLRCMAHLLQAGADPNAPAKDGRLPLRWVKYWRSVSTVDVSQAIALLERAGSKPD